MQHLTRNLVIAIVHPHIYMKAQWFLSKVFCPIEAWKGS